MKTFKGNQVIRQGTFNLPINTEQAFEFFTPLGECVWADDWNPVFVYPETGELCESMVFITTHENLNTIWSVVVLDMGNKNIRYSRITPGSHTGTVDVKCIWDSQKSVKVNVRYTLTGLTERGNQYLDAEFSVDSYESMLKEWRAAILPHCQIESVG